MKKIKILIDENNRLIGYCDYGEMENSIEIEIEDNFEFKTNIQNYTYVNGNLEYRDNLDELKKQKLEELKNARDSFIKSDLDMNGDLFQVRNTEDRDKFNRIILGLLLKKLKKEDTEEWKLANNTYKVFTYAELSNIPDLYSAREREAFKKFHQLDDKLQACNTTDEIMALKW